MAKPSDIKKIDLADLQVDRDEAQKELDKVNDKIWEEKNAIDEKYKAERDAASSKLSQVKEKIDEMQKDIRRMVIEEDWDEAVQKEIVDEFYLKAFLTKCGLDFHISTSGIGSSDSMSAKKPLKNGIRVWLINRDFLNHDKLYLAFHGTNLVGLSYRITARHAGDDTEPYSFIGDLDKLLTVVKKKKNWTVEKEFNSTFTDWMKELEKIDENNMPVIPTNSNTFEHIRMGVKDYWEYYGWQRRKKELENESV